MMGDEEDGAPKLLWEGDGYAVRKFGPDEGYAYVEFNAHVVCLQIEAWEGSEPKIRFGLPASVIDDFARDWMIKRNLKGLE